MSPQPTQSAWPATDASLVQQRSLFFSVSRFSGRVFLYNNNRVYLGQSLMPGDLGAIKAAAGIIGGKSKQGERRAILRACSVLLQDQAKVQEVAFFLESWNALRPIEQADLAANVIRPPLLAELHRVRTRRKLNGGASSGGRQGLLSFARYSKKSSDGVVGGASGAGSADSSSTSTSSSGGRSSNGGCLLRACVNCGKAYGNLLPSGTCTWKCHQELCVRLSGSSIRRQLLELEKGICCLCKLDAHAVFKRFKRLHPSDRVQELMRLSFPLPTKLAGSGGILHDPKEGDFWQADHILPVSEGGGECTLENIRTLCSKCHRRETQKLLRRLKSARAASSARGTRSILSFFGTGGDQVKQQHHHRHQYHRQEEGADVVDLTSL